MWDSNKGLKLLDSDYVERMQETTKVLVNTLGDVPIRPSAILTNHSLTLTKYVSIVIYDYLSTSVNKLVERDLLFALIPL
jgi:hypothetical protein